MTPETKLQWLQRHDKESGDLYGMLPLVEGMPVMLTGHLDRNPAKNLLRGSRGNIVGWIEHPEEDNTTHQSDEQSRILTKVPLAVFVKFDNAKWTLPGVAEPGAYPVRPQTAECILDKGRKSPKLKIRRRQIPLAPGFAMTAHASQGATLAQAIVDLRIPAGASKLASYVAMSRVRRREDILIFREFDRSVFQGEPPEGPTLLLKKLRDPDGWQENWRAMVHRSRVCSGCSTDAPASMYTAEQWAAFSKNRLCLECQADGVECRSVKCENRIRNAERWVKLKNKND